MNNDWLLLVKGNSLGLQDAGLISAFESKNTTISQFLYLCPTVLNLNEDANILHLDAVRPGGTAVLFWNNVPVRCNLAY